MRLWKLTAAHANVNWSWARNDESVENSPGSFSTLLSPAIGWLRSSQGSGRFRAAALPEVLYSELTLTRK